MGQIPRSIERISMLNIMLAYLCYSRLHENVTFSRTSTANSTVTV